MKDDVALTTTLTALAGGVLWGMANIFTIVFAPKPPAKREIVRALVGTLFALISAAIGGAIVAPWIVRTNGIEDVESISLIGLFVGLGFWASVPLLIHLATRFIPGVFGRLGTVLTTAPTPSQPTPPEAD